MPHLCILRGFVETSGSLLTILGNSKGYIYNHSIYPPRGDFCCKKLPRHRHKLSQEIKIYHMKYIKLINCESTWIGLRKRCVQSCDRNFLQNSFCKALIMKVMKPIWLFAVCINMQTVIPILGNALCSCLIWAF